MFNENDTSNTCLMRIIQVKHVMKMILKQQILNENDTSNTCLMKMN